MEESYRNTDKRPFGSYIAYRGFRDYFQDRYIEVVRAPFDQQWHEIKDYVNENGYSLYFLIAKNLVFTSDELNDLLQYVQQGNDIFIASDYVDATLLQDLNCREDRQEGIQLESKGIMNQTKVFMDSTKDSPSKSYGYYYYPFVNSLSGFDPSFCRVLGRNEKGEPNYVVFFSGKGRIYLDVAPRTLSNYFLLTCSNYQYLEKVLSYLRTDPKNIYWDEYYKNTTIDQLKNRHENADNFSSLSVINQNPPLKWAFWLVVVGMVIFLLFNMKRRQRMIPVKIPNLNTTVNFTETVGRLYLQKRNNRHIAEKMITYLFENIRNKYFIGTSQINEEFLARLAGKSGRNPEELRRLVDLVYYVQSHESLPDEKLMELNAEIEKFYQIIS